jgi:alkylation response protein AidB-like acyl-CoA dehydrogenase
MNFDFSEEQKLLQKTTRDYLEEHAPLSVARQVLESATPYSEELWKGAAEMGWLGAAVPEAYGGAGFGALELALIAEEIGRALSPIPFSSSVYLATEALLLAGNEEQKQRYLPRLASGEWVGTLALAERPGRIAPDDIQTRFSEGRLQGTKLPVPDGNVAGLAVVVARDGDGLSLVLAELDGQGVEKSAVRCIDPSRTQGRLGFAGAPAEPLGARGAGWDLTQRILDRAAVLMAFEQIGGAQRAFEMTREFCLGRYAFGRPIASFQAIKHRLADLYVAIELARSNAYYGVWALSNNSPELAGAACGARASAGDAFERASEEMIQLYGGVGFTWEYDCHLFYRRAKLLGLALGTASEWRDKLIERVSN